VYGLDVSRSGFGNEDIVWLYLGHYRGVIESAGFI
jgi:hypothetical protein